MTPHTPDWETQPLRLSFSSQIPRPGRSAVNTIRASFWYLGDTDLLSQRFNARLLCLTPRAERVLRDHFPRDGEHFISALLRPLEALAAQEEGLPDADGVSQVRHLGSRLGAAGMRGQDFAYIGLALVRAVRDSYTAPWSTSLGTAWTQVHEWMVAHLVEGAGEAGGPTPGPPSPGVVVPRDEVAG